MGLLGARLRLRRRQMKLHQRDVAGRHSGSFLSKVENGVSLPSLGNLREWSNKLQTTTADLLGDHLVLEAAKQCLLLTDRCHDYLERLDASQLTCFLKQLSSSATALSVAVPDPPSDPELRHLTVKVLLHRGMLQEAKDLAEDTLPCIISPLLRIHHLVLLCQIYRELPEPAKEIEAKEALRTVLQELDYNELFHKLPDAEAISAEDLNLLAISRLIEHHNFL